MPTGIYKRTKPVSQETKDKIGAAKKGSIVTLQSRKKIRLTILRKGLGFQKGYTPWNKGKKGLYTLPEHLKIQSSLRLKKYWENDEKRSELILKIKKSMANPKIKSLLSELNKRPRRPMSDSHKSKISTANMGKMPSNMISHNHYPNIQSGDYSINGKEIYFRSKWEANYALYLDWLVKQKQIKKWEFEAERFVFEKIKFGTRSYLPDFKIWNNDDTIEFHEIKGYMDSKSKTKLKRMKRYFPNIKLILIQQDSYTDIKSKVGKMLNFY